VEAVRICRAASGRPVVLYFDGKYHGHADELLLGGLDRVGPEVRGVPETGAAVTRVVAFNDLAAVEGALEREDVACVLIEPALTNVGVVLPEPGFHEAIAASGRRSTRPAPRSHSSPASRTSTHTSTCSTASWPSCADRGAYAARASRGRSSKRR
jgi:hypothetical protein